MSTNEPRIIIVGGGPAGLVLAIELGRRGVPCLVLERGNCEPGFPKANSTTSRTMEHYRRLGLTEEIRRIGLPDDYAPDVSYHTRYAGYELARLHWPSRSEALARRFSDDPKWPTPEPMHRGQQMYIEPILKKHAVELGAVDLRLGWQTTKVEEVGDRVRVEAHEIASGRSEVFEADYVVGCEGARSLVRQAMGVGYEGFAGETRDFMGGRMMASFLKAPAFYEQGPAKPSWQYWCINTEQRSVMMAVDGKGLFAFHTQLSEGQEPTVELAKAAFDSVVGKKIPYEVLGVAEWTAGFTLVAEKMSSGRMFLAGDAAHLFTPTAGLGYNTSVDDVANLGWKLAAVVNGWGGPDLLASYQVERKPIAHRNTAFARSIAEFFRQLDLPKAIETVGPDGDAARKAYGERLHAFAEREFAAPGIILGVLYADSPIVAQEDGPLPPDDPNYYVPHGRPGARAPHVWLPDGRALFDHLGPDFTLLKLRSDADASSFAAAARACGAPLTVVEFDSEPTRDLYGADLILIRPDQHIAWRGQAADDAEAAEILAMATGTRGVSAEGLQLSPLAEGAPVAAFAPDD